LVAANSFRSRLVLRAADEASLVVVSLTTLPIVPCGAVGGIGRESDIVAGCGAAHELQRAVAHPFVGRPACEWRRVAVDGACRPDAAVIITANVGVVPSE
jgi:hypothetical protein